MSKRDERFNRTEELIASGMSKEDVIAHVCDEYKVKPVTVEKDIEALEAQSQPLPFGDDEPGLLDLILSNAVDAHEANLDEIKYTPEANEKDSVHVLIETPTYNNARPPKKESKPLIQKFDLKAWTNFATYYTAQGYTIHKVLHLPKGARPLSDIDPFGTARKA